MVRESGCKVRRDSVMMVKTLITASTEFMNSLPPAEQKAYFEVAFDFIASGIRLVFRGVFLTITLTV